MISFNEFIRNEQQNPTPRHKTEPKISPPFIQQPSQAKLAAARISEQVSKAGTGDIVTSLSQQIVSLNHAIVGDPSSTLVVKRLSEMILRLHFLILVVLSDGGGNG